MKNSSSLISGVLFGTGLAASGMTDTAKVLGFLDVTGDWVPDLLFVMISALLVTLITFRLILKRSAPLCDTSFALPQKKRLDSQLIWGAALFGIGWGIYGYCPGPAIASLAYLQLETVAFVVMMILGMFVADIRIFRR
ncbi:MAG: putative membrane protein YedE/YeeE [Cellvibrionaceae bacterium]|jgi:uncharacterized membrane protein YedE/YeeE